MMCGSGVHVRSIARDLGIALNCFGHITKLRRTMVGDFRENESVTIEQLIEKTRFLVSFQRVTLESKKKEPVSATQMTPFPGGLKSQCPYTQWRQLKEKYKR